MNLPITEEQIVRWQSGTLIQNAMPDLTPEQREFLISGCTPEEWRKLFGTPENPTGSDEHMAKLAAAKARG